MKRAEYEEQYNGMEFDIKGVNQYSVDITVNDGGNKVRVRVPIRDTIVGDCGFLPRDKNFEIKERIKRVIQFETDYLPVLTPEVTIGSVESDKNMTFYQVESKY